MRGRVHTAAVARQPVGAPVHIEASEASRKPKRKAYGSEVGTIIDPFRKREIHVESKLERFHYTCKIARPETVKLREQVYVTCKDGHKQLTHYIDLIETHSDGTREAVFVKPERKKEASKLPYIVQTIADKLGRAVADRFVILTEEDVNWTTLRNSEAIIRCGSQFDYEARDRVLRLLGTHSGRITPLQAGELTELGRRGSDALIALLQSGVVRLTDSSSLIELDTPFDNFVERQLYA